MLLLAFNSTAGWQAIGHGGRYSTNNPSIMNLEIPGSPGVTVHLDLPRHAVRHADPFMAVTSPKWEGSNVDFEAALSRLASYKELPELRFWARTTEKRMLHAIDTEDYAEAARLRDGLRELRSKDPTMLSSSLRAGMEAAAKDNRFEDAAMYRDQLRALKHFQPEYNLGGTWMAKARGQGDILVRICYNDEYGGDTLTALRLDASGNVTGEVSFKADVSESHDGGSYTASSRMMDQNVKFIGPQGENKVGQNLKFLGEGMVAGGGSFPGQMYVLSDDVIVFDFSPLGEDDGERQQVAARGLVEERHGGGKDESEGRLSGLVVFRRKDKPTVPEPLQWVS